MREREEEERLSREKRRGREKKSRKGRRILAIG